MSRHTTGVWVVAGSMAVASATLIAAFYYQLIAASERSAGAPSRNRHALPLGLPDTPAIIGLTGWRSIQFMVRHY